MYKSIEKDIINVINNTQPSLSEGKVVKHNSWTTIEYVNFPSEFWVVTKPGFASELKDIVFKTDISILMMRASKGFSVSDIVMISLDEKSAKKLGEELIQNAQDEKLKTVSKYKNKVV